jgi:uncharacterized protein (DUF934 family)
MAIIKDGRICENQWRHLGDDEALPRDGGVTVSLKRWLAEKEALLKRGAPVGLRLNSEDSPEEIADDAQHFGVIVLDFKQFTDGRGFSQARLLRERFGFEGELRARGDYIRDQVFFLSRVGIDAFEFADAQAAENALPALQEFSVKYQAAADVPEPLYRRRHRKD